MQYMKRSFLGVLAIGLMLVIGTSAADANQRAEIAAIVNDDIITTTDIKTRLRLNTGGRPIPQAEQKIAHETVLDELINEVLKDQEARSLNITVDDTQVRDAFTTIAQNNNMPADEFRGAINRMGVPIEAFFDKIETDIAWSQVVRRKLRPQVAISETDIDAVFDDMKRTEGKIQYRVAEIFVATNPLEGSSEARKKLESLAQQITRGARFSEVAKRHSEAPGASRGGDLGWQTLEQMDTIFQPVVLKMQRGQLSPIVKSPRGLHLLLLIDQKSPTPANTPKTAPKPEPVANVAPDKLRLQQIFLPVAPNEPTALRSTKMARAQSLKNEITNCADMKARFDNFQSPLTGDLGYVSIGDLPEGIAKEVSALKIGDLSKPMVNNQGIFVLMVCERKSSAAPVTATAAPTILSAEVRDDENAREEVANSIGSKKLEALQQRYLRDLRAAAFIDRRI